MKSSIKSKRKNANIMALKSRWKDICLHSIRTEQEKQEAKCHLSEFSWEWACQVTHSLG
jgi:hypothetical protein